MIKEIFSDIAAACSFYGQQRKNRKNNSSSVIRIPVYVMKPAFYNTIEGCRLANCGKKADEVGRMAFKAMPYETQRAMEFGIEQDEFIERALLWQDYLRRVAPGKDGHTAMVGILSWYRHMKHMRNVNNEGKNNE